MANSQGKDNPRFDRSAFREAQRLQWRGEYETALRYFEQALRDEPENAQIYWEKGETLVRAGRRTEAIPCWEQAAQLSPDYAERYQESKRRSRILTEMNLLRTGSAAEAAQLIDWICDKDNEIREAAQNMLSESCVFDAAAFDTLAAGLLHSHSDVRAAACEALGRVGDPRAIPALRGALADPTPYVRQAAAQALEKMGIGPLDDPATPGAAVLPRQAEQPPEVESLGPTEPREIETYPLRGEGVFNRAAALMIDGLLLYLSYWLLTLLVQRLGRPPFRAEFAPLFLGVGGLLYFTLFEGVWGVTPGKAIGNLRVRRWDGERCGLGRALARAVLLPIDLLLVGPALIWLSPRKQRLGDRLAGTLALKRSRLHRVTLHPNRVIFRYHDASLRRLDSLTQVEITRFGALRRLRLLGIAPDGKRSRLAFSNAAFITPQRLDDLAAALADHFGLVCRRRVEWWRMLLVVLALAVDIGLIYAFAASLLNSPLPAW